MDDLKKMQKLYERKAEPYGTAKPQTDHTAKYQDKQLRQVKQSRERHQRQKKSGY